MELGDQLVSQGWKRGQWDDLDPPHVQWGGRRGVSYDNYKYKYENIQTQKQIRDETQAKHIPKYKYERQYKYKHKVGTLHQVAYYENPGILMIVQSVEDQEGTKTNQGDCSNQYQ